MTGYEKLLTDADKENIIVTDRFDLSGTRLKGLYCDGTIALNKEMHIESEKTCVLAEELGHHATSSGNILDQSSTSNRKQELIARMWAYNRLVGLDGILDCYKAGCHTLYDMAEHLGVTEGFLSEALSCYKNKYGICTQFDNYVIYFEPGLSVLELI